MQRDELEELGRSLPVPPWRRAAIVRELRSHVEEARTDLMLSGWPADDARREARARLGDADEIVSGFAAAYRPSSRVRVGLALALSAGMLLGVFGVKGTLAFSPNHSQTSRASIVHRGATAHHLRQRSSSSAVH